MTNGEYTYDHKLQYFPNFLRRRAVNWFVRYETTHLAATWDDVEWAFVNQFNMIHNEGQVATTLRYAKKKKKKKKVHKRLL